MHERISGHVWNNVNVDGMGYTTCVETDPHLLTFRDNKNSSHEVAQQSQWQCVRMAYSPAHEILAKVAVEAQ